MGMFDGPNSLGHSFMDERDPAFENTYGDSGNMSYDEWMRANGYEPGSYGPGDGFEEWLASVTGKGKDRVYLGNKIKGTKVENESATETKPSISEPESTTVGSAEATGSSYDWVTKDETLGDTSDASNSDAVDENYDRGMYEYALGMLRGNRKNDKDEDMGVFGTYDTIGKQIEEAQKSVKKYEDRYENDAEILGKIPKYKEATDLVSKLQETQKTLQDYVDKYKTNYEKDENKGKSFTNITEKEIPDVTKAHEEWKNSVADSEEANRNFTRTLIKNKININDVTAKDVVQDVLDGNGEKYSNDVVEAAKEAVNKENAIGYKKDLLDAAQKGFREAMAASDTSKQQAVLNAYKNGEINAFQAAVDLANLQATESFVEMGEHDISVPMDEYGKKLSTTDLMAATTDLGKSAARTETAKDIETVVYSTLSQIKEELDKIDVSSVTNEKEAKEVGDKISDLASQATTIANDSFVEIYKELVKSGISAKELASNPRVKEHAQEAFGIGQDIYERASELEAKTNELGLTADNLKKSEIKKNLDEISVKVGQLDAENNKAVGSYYSPGSNMNGTGTAQPTGINLTKEEVEALSDYAEDVQSTKDAGIAIMKSAAMNGATDVKGGKYAEAWKESVALEKGGFNEGFGEFVKDQGKLTWKDYFSAAAKGALSLVVTVAGIATMAVNPGVGILLTVAGSTSHAKAGIDIATDVARSKSTNKEMMFGSGETGKDVVRDIYNRTNEEANFGDAKSVGTYTTLASGALGIISGFTMLAENPILGMVAIREGLAQINKAGKGGLSNNLNTAVDNIYQLGIDISTFLDRADLSPENLGLTPSETELVSKSTSRDVEIDKPTVADATYGSASSVDNPDIDNRYSGYVEDAKNKNLATDYNAGMEQEVNEAVSDKYAKVFKVMIDKEPDYIRKVLIAIPKMHSEREW